MEIGKLFEHCFFYLFSTGLIHSLDSAAAHLKINNFESAVNDARKSIEIDANFTKGYYRLGTALFKLKRNLDALDALEKALDVDSKFGGGAMTSSISALKDEILVSMGKKSAPANNIFGGDSGLESLLSNPMMSQYMNSPA